MADRRSKTKTRSSPESVSGRPEAVRIRLLGGFKVSVGSRTIEEDAWRLRKAASLVKLLALASGHRLHREQAMEALWPELGKRAASNNLRGAIYAARKALASHPTRGSRYLASQDESLVLCEECSLWVDAEVFEQAATILPAAPEILQPIRWRSSCMPGTFCRGTATRSGRRNPGGGSGRCISRSWGASVRSRRARGERLSH